MHYVLNLRPNSEKITFLARVLRKLGDILIEDLNDILDANDALERVQAVDLRDEKAAFAAFLFGLRAALTAFTRAVWFFA